MAKATGKKKFRRLDDRQLRDAAVRYSKAKAIEKGAKKLGSDLQEELLAELAAREVGTVELPGVKVTRAQQEPTLSRDEDALWAALKPRQRDEVFTEKLDLNALPDPTKERLVAALRPAERRAVSSRWLDESALQSAVAAGRIAAALVAAHTTTEKEKAPYIVVTITND
jgi:hypothetical protein